jgi:cytoskeletal protein RodZ
MESFGQYLKQERERRGVSLEEINRRTRISLNILQALESGQTANLPTPVILRGFIKGYAKTIGLDPAETLSRFAEESQAPPPAPATVRSVPETKRPRVLPMAVITLGVIAAVTVLLRLVGEQAPPPLVGTPAPAPVPAAVSAPPETPAALTQTEPAAPAEGETTLPGAPAALPLGAQPQAAPVTQGPVPAAAARRPGEPHLLKVRALEQTWLRLARDDGSVNEYLLQPGEQVVWEAAQRFELTVGNAAGLVLSLNGKPVGPLGPRGQVVHLILPQPPSRPAPSGQGPMASPKSVPAASATPGPKTGPQAAPKTAPKPTPPEAAPKPSPGAEPKQVEPKAQARAEPRLPN